LFFFFIQGNLSALLDNIKQGLGERIQERSWLDGITKERALNKLKFIESFTAYPREILNNTFLDLLYVSCKPPNMYTEIYLV